MIWTMAFATFAAQGELIGKPGEWISHGNGAANTKYSPLDQIHSGNFKDLTVVWRWKSISGKIAEANPRLRRSQFKPTPLVVNGVMYVVTEFCQVAALGAGSGRLIWEFDPESYKAGRPANVGFQHRGLSYWTDGSEERLFLASHDRKLWAINPKTGKPFADFGDNGRVDLEGSLGRKIVPGAMTHSSPVGICRDTVIVGSIVFDGGTTKEMPPGHVRGFDARTGRMKWIFHTIPQEGEFGTDTWEDDSWKYSGNTNVWSMFAADEALGYVYLPVSTPTDDMYGGHRLGDNLFGESLVCLDAETGKRIWHFQAVHHGMWDYDFPTAPNLVDITVDGQPIKAVAQVSKQGFCYVFNRVTGEPVWPIEERSVDTHSTVDGERPSPTQPFPTKPEAYTKQGFTKNDVIDFTPEIRAGALKVVDGFTMGPLFTPPSEKGTLGRPGAGGGSNWPGAAFDPVTATLYVPSSGGIGFFRVVRPDPARSNLKFVSTFTGEGAPDTSALRGLPLSKPPYSSVTAINLNTGDHMWMTPHGDGPINHPLLKDLNLHPLGAGGSGRGPLVTKTLLFVSQGGDPRGTARDSVPKITVFDKKTGRVLGDIPLPGDPHGNPVTYSHGGKQYIAIALGGGRFYGGPSRYPAEIVALALP